MRLAPAIGLVPLEPPQLDPHARIVVARRHRQNLLGRLGHEVARQSVLGADQRHRADRGDALAAVGADQHPDIDRVDALGRAHSAAWRSDGAPSCCWWYSTTALARWNARGDK